MADIDIAQELPVPVERPPQSTRGVLDWLRVNLFGSVLNTILTLVAAYILAVSIPPVIRWGLVDAIWSAPNGQACRGAGASRSACNPVDQTRSPELIRQT